MSQHRLWLVRETDLARLYSKIDPANPAREPDEVWVPRSIIEGCRKQGREHYVTLPDWFVEKNRI